MGWVLVAAACSGSDDGPGQDTEFTCAKAERGGTYLLSYSERSGNCGPVPETVVVLSAAELEDGIPPEGCSYDLNAWAPDECSVEVRGTCTTAEGEYELSSKTTQMDENADRLAGISTITVRDPDGNLVCMSTYDMNYSRQ